MYSLFEPLIKIYKLLYLFAYDITGNYGIALVLLSLFTFIVLYPFNKKAQIIQKKEHKIQAVLAPQIAIIKSHYNGREQYEQLQWLYQRYGYHPLYAIRSALGFIFQIPFLTAAYYMLSGLEEIQGIMWGIIPNLGVPDHLMAGINVLPFVMTLVTCVYAFVMPEISRKERLQTVAIGVFFLLLLYNAPSALLIFWTCNLVWSLLDSILSKKLEWLGIFVSKNELALHVIFALSITTGLLVPTEVYIRNAGELWFKYKDILKYLITDSATYFAVLLIIYFICCWRTKIRNIFLAVLTGLLFGVFLQSYIINVNYGMFDGHEIEWSNYTKIGLINTFIWLFCLGAAFEYFKRRKFDFEAIKKIIKPACFLIFVIQCLVLVITLKAYPFQKNIAFEDGKAGVLTTKDIYTISSKDNIVVFLLDAFDASVFEEVQQKNPEVISEFKDFTYYPDTTSSFGFTHYSLPEILTGELYDPQERYLEYQKRAWNNNFYYSKLREKDYIVNLYTSGNFIDKSAPVDNLVTKKIQMNRNVANIFINVAKFRMVPHFFKKAFYSYQSIYSPAIVNDNIMNYVEDDREFYKGLKRGLKTEEKNAFRFYHLSGMHFPYVLDENVEYIKAGEKGTAYKQALGVLKIVREYLAQLKEKNLYANSTLVVMADHGNHNEIGSRPLFMVKQPFSSQEAMVISDKPQSVANLMPIVAERFGKDFDSKKTGNRYFYYENKEQGMQFFKYLVKSPAKDLASWISLGRVGRRLSADKNYKIGEEIDFSCFGNSYKYKNDGWQDREETFGSAIDNHEADMNLVISGLKNKSKNLTVEINCHPLLHFFPAEAKTIYRNLELYANNNLIGQWHITGQGTQILTCMLPANLINKGALHLRFVVINPMSLKGEKEVFQINKLMIKESER